MARFDDLDGHLFPAAGLRGLSQHQNDQVPLIISGAELNSKLGLVNRAGNFILKIAGLGPCINDEAELVFNHDTQRYEDNLEALNASVVSEAERIKNEEI